MWRHRFRLCFAAFDGWRSFAFAPVAATAVASAATTAAPFAALPPIGSRLAFDRRHRRFGSSVGNGAGIDFGRRLGAVDVVDRFVDPAITTIAATATTATTAAITRFAGIARRRFTGRDRVDERLLCWYRFFVALGARPAAAIAAGFVARLTARLVAGLGFCLVPRVAASVVALVLAPFVAPAVTAAALLITATASAAATTLAAISTLAAASAAATTVSALASALASFTRLLARRSRCGHHGFGFRCRRRSRRW